MKRIASPSEIAEYLYFYASEKNSFTTKSIIEATGVNNKLLDNKKKLTR